MDTISAQQDRLTEARTILRKALEPAYGKANQNPVVLLDRLAVLQDRCARVQERVQLLAKVKQELVDEMYTQSWDQTSDIHQYQGNAVADALQGLAMSGEPAEALDAARNAQAQINELFESSNASWKGYFISPATQAELNANVISSRTDLDVAVRAAAQHDLENIAEDGPEQDTQEEEEEEDAAQLTYTVDADAFAALPESIRGRARLSDVQRTLSIIVAHKEKQQGKQRGPNRRRGGRAQAAVKPLSIKELDSMGAKVVGHTGACVLQCLRSLGLVDISKDGVQLKF